MAHSDKIILTGTLGEHSRAVFIVAVRKSEELLIEIRKNPLGKKAKSIGEVETKVGKPGELTSRIYQED